MALRRGVPTLRLFALLALLGSCTTASGWPASTPHTWLNRELPQFRRNALDGSTVSTVELRGRPAVIKFFADYCEPCKRSLPEAERLHRAHPNIVFVGVSEDERASVAQRLVSSYGLTFSVVHDAGAMLRGKFRVTELPATFVIDRAGVVRWIAGEREEPEELAQALAAAER